MGILRAIFVFLKAFIIGRAAAAIEIPALRQQVAVNMPERKNKARSMVRLYHPLLFLLARSTRDDLQKQIEFLKKENELLRKRVPRQRIFLKPNERVRLLK